MSNPNKEVLEYRGPYTDMCYSRFFNPNMCYVCKSVDRGNLIFCNFCHLIPYCSEEHKAMHHSTHMRICLDIASVLQEISGGTRRFDNWQQWIQSRKELTELIQQRVSKIDPYMKQVILWSKSCYVCHQQTDLQVCQRCFSANYCDEHANIFHTKHVGNKCDQLMLSLNIDIETISGSMNNMSYKFLQVVNKTSDFEEMLQFYIEFVLPQKEDIIWLAKDYVQSDQFSDPLTIYFGLKKLGRLDIIRKPYVVIHVIATMTININCAAVWEILLHLLPEIQHLIIVIVGMRLNKYLYVSKLCERCRNRKNILHLISYDMLYKKYITSRRYKVPTIIVGFHIDPDENLDVLGNTLSEVINIIRFVSCPLVLSFSSAKKAQQFIDKMTEILDIHVDPHLKMKNYFSGLVPHKDVDTGDIYFFNDYLIIYLNY
ncbi:uncharacterized protein LOC116846787 [Odontomachus brunneus]|uniref:uncharacterized protein LOC116846787 n=1 Tax=Odontomachus brunneus TaxID=486640 RepID=UPI0013F21EEB|nr:uncharacterized protein LOC116846787 [Odontomachus brunneus]